MEQPIEFDLELALHQFICSYNSKGILSQMDQDELLDHMYLEIEALQKSGLSTEEAFIISSKRLGSVDMLTTEYEKAKPWSRMIQLLVFAGIVFWVVKMLFNLLKVVSLSATIIVHEFSSIDMSMYVQWGDIGVQILCLIVSIPIGMMIFKKVLSSKLGHLWPILLIYIVSEIATFGVQLIFTSKMGPSILGPISLNTHYMSFILTIFGILMILGLSLKYRNLSLQF